MLSYVVLLVYVTAHAKPVGDSSLVSVQTFNIYRGLIIEDTPKSFPDTTNEKY